MRSMLDVDRSYAENISTVRGKEVPCERRCNFKEDGQRRCWSQPLRFLGREHSKQGLHTYFYVNQVNF